MATTSDITPISIPYSSLLLPPTPALLSQIHTAFSSSPQSLGLLLITHLPPSFPQLRRNLLLQSNSFASLPREEREKYANKESKYSFGWSEGKEIMNGVPDTLKGSFYANPDIEDSKNIWPKEEECPGYKRDFEKLCGFMVEVGGLVAKLCDGFVKEAVKENGGKGEVKKGVQELLEGSGNSKARLLHYFPRQDLVYSLSPSPSLEEEKIDDTWCGTHIDHSLLTALCPAIYLFHPIIDGEEDGDGKGLGLEPIVIPPPSKSTGLFIKARDGRIIKGAIPEDCLAFQTGETLQLLTSESLAATPHFVNSTSETLSATCISSIKASIESKIAEGGPESERWEKVSKGRVSRETLAVFLQPNDEEVVSPKGETFGEFTKRVLERHY